MIGTWFYAGLLVLSAVAWPLLFAESQPHVAIVLAALNLALFIFVWRSCSTTACSYWQGLNIIAGSMMSGCANITILYAPIVLVAVYLISIVHAVRGLHNEQRPAGPRWESLVLWFHERRFRGRDAC